ncbi:hypothetical protein GTQ43_17125 [Nostoc sp. KVJ3]|uniref:hypothetical protein n=1 Tax=Nostoc sp. KVJ3 TaxID=457945 RepID=UPI0022376B35|nr:hypothetical protein [Nostoc sp. KVJ3]MCW5315468.1 hypothetical protein [Nostoc sp. KVJ3]
MSDPSTGFLSQAIANAEAVERQIASFGNIPDTAQTIQSQSITLLNNTIPKIQAIQAKIQNFASLASLQLTKAESELSNNTSLDTIKFLLLQVNTEANSLKTDVDGADSITRATFSDIAELSKQLNGVESTLNSEIISLNVQLQSASQEVSAIQSKEKYYALLGILGLAGLAAAIALLVEAEKKLNSLASNMHSLSGQASQLSMISTAVKSMNADFLTLSNKLLSLKNAVDFLSSDISEVINDIDNAKGERTMAKLYILTSLREVQTLKIDAS